MKGNKQRVSKEQLKELQEYNLEFLEAQASEEMFGGDYISAVELKYANKEIERLNNIIKEVREYANNIKFETKREEKIQDDILKILDKGSE